MKLLKFMLLLGLLTAVSSSFATVFYSKNEAMELAFGKGTPVEQLALFPDEQQIAQIQQLAKVKLDMSAKTKTKYSVMRQLKPAPSEPNQKP
ncbi:MAG: hypothetical protein LUO95_10805 [Methylococcaceae bacterium]|nr:hypothetical protein [Methylococcaceae bacterium]